jgi:hypothetical protein
VLYKVVVERDRRVERALDGGYDAAELAARPDRYRSALGRYLKRFTVLVNGVYWEPGMPRLVTREQVQALWASRGGRACRHRRHHLRRRRSVEVNVRARPRRACYVYEAGTGPPTRRRGAGPRVGGGRNCPASSRRASEHFR